MSVYTQAEMIDDLFPHPEKDADHDGYVSFRENLVYVLKMIPYSIMRIMLPTLEWAFTEGVREFWPLAVGFVRELAESALTGDEKRAEVTRRLAEAAAEQGVVLGQKAINRLIENALAYVEQEYGT